MLIELLSLLLDDWVGRSPLECAPRAYGVGTGRSSFSAQVIMDVGVD
jgi:phage portal protein BeeE